MLRGQEHVQHRVRAALTSARAGRAQVIRIEGGPGAGKTALLADAASTACGLGFQVWQTSGLEGETDLSLAGLSVLLRPLSGELDRLCSRLSEAQAHAVLAAAGRADANATADRFTLGAGLLGLTAAAAEQRPLLLLIDDAHWLDRASAEALGFSARRLGADAVTVVVAARPGHQDGALSAITDRLHLRALTPSQVTEVLAEAGLAVTTQVGEAIAAATGGVPLAVLETARGLTAGQRNGREPLPEPLPIGAEVTAGYRVRLTDLDPSAQAAVSVVAVAGGAPVTAVRRALAATGHTDADLRGAEDGGVLTLTGSGIRFVHP
ncbi:MAG TPA: ATP-binding protein, partial [Pseudonocardia sp.]